MENNEKLVKVYSNNSKKARLKRNKNKFQRIWDAEKQTYIKVRKSKYPVRQNKNKSDWREIDKSSAIKRRQNTQKEIKSAPVTAIKQKSEAKQTVRKEQARIKNKHTDATVVKINGVSHTWDTNTLRYKRVA